MLHRSSSGFYRMCEEIWQGRWLSTALPHRASGLLLSLLWVHVIKSPDLPAACRAVRFAVPTVRPILNTSHDAITAEVCRRVRGNENLTLPLVLTAANSCCSLPHAKPLLGRWMLCTYACLTCCRGSDTMLRLGSGKIAPDRHFRSRKL
jgi:hypothetical protein